MAAIDKPSINLQRRVKIALALVALAFFLIGVRLWYLQILNGDYFRSRSENNLLRKMYITPPRGLLLDRNGAVLAKNRPSYNIEMLDQSSVDREIVLERLSPLIDTSVSDLEKKARLQKKRRRFEPKQLAKDLSRDTVARIAASRHSLPGIFVDVTPTRDYVYGSLAAHVLGYIREITKSQLDSGLYPGYRPGELVGQSGIEKKWERLLHGQTGVQAVVVNAAGVRISEHSYQSESPGHELMLTLDLDVQRAAEEALLGVRGAIVAMDPNNGEVIAMASSPSFDPNVFTGEVPDPLWTSFLRGLEKPLQNRAFQGEYPPGSVFKIFMAVAGLSEKLVSPNDRVFCPGYFSFGGRSFRCHKHSGHGSVNLREAIVQSCDVYFYTLGRRLGIDRIHHYSKLFGLAELTGIDLGSERPGLVPSTTWKKRAFRRKQDQKWYPGETISVAIGQGATITTPLQIARSIAAVVNGGTVLKPVLERKILQSEGQTFDENFGNDVVRKVAISPKILDTVRDAMVGVVNDPRGTGHRAQLNEQLQIMVGGKTGTAQVVAMTRGKGPSGPDDHAWFVGFAPAEKPELVVVALIENGGHGGSAAAPRVKDVMDAFFMKQRAATPQMVFNIEEPKYASKR